MGKLLTTAMFVVGSITSFVVSASPAEAGVCSDTECNYTYGAYSSWTTADNQRDSLKAMFESDHQRVVYDAIYQIQGANQYMVDLVVRNMG